MQKNKILFYYLFINILVLVGIMILYFFSTIGKGIMLSVYEFLFMALSSWLYLHKLTISLNSSNKNIFIHVVMVNIFIKMVSIMLIVAIYYKIYNPQKKIIIIPFLVIYLIYSVFETYFSYKLSLKSK
jgi:hypothetical protein